MIRSRNIKPGFFRNEDLGELDPIIRLFFIGLWCAADKEGRLEDRPKRLWAELMPYDDFMGEESLGQLQLRGFVIRYEIDGCRYVQIANFLKHQSPHHKEAASVIPAPPGWKAQQATEDQRQANVGSTLAQRRINVGST